MRTMHPTLFLPAGFQLAVTVLLAIVPLVSAASPSQLSRRVLGSLVQQRQPPPLRPGWVPMSCVTDDPNQPTLTAKDLSNDAWSMSVELCVSICDDSHLALAGLKNGNTCFCGNIMTKGATPTSYLNCQTPCPANQMEFCGGPKSLSIWWNGVRLQATPTITQSVGEWNIVGCYSDSGNARTLHEQIYIIDGVTVAGCINSCFHKNYTHAGVEFANECWCGNGTNPSGEALDSTFCSVLACPGNSLEYCGAAQRMIIYKQTPSRRVGSGP